MKNTNNYLQDVDKDCAVNNPEEYYNIALAAVKQNAYALQFVDKDWAEKNSELYNKIALEAVEQNPMALKHVNTCKNNEYYYDIALVAMENGYALQFVDKDWAKKNPEKYYDIALVAMEDRYALPFVDKDWAEKNSELYNKIALEAVKKNAYALQYVNTCKNNEYYYDIALAAVNQRGYTLEYVNKDWAVENPKWYYDIALEAVSQNGLALNCVNKNWAEKNSELYKKIALEAVSQGEMAFFSLDAMILSSTQYYDILLEAVSQNGLSLRFVNQNWVLNNPELYKEIALAAVSQNGMALEFAKDLQNNQKIVLAALSQNEFALQFADEVFRNNMKIAISSLIGLDSKHSKSVFTFEGIISKILSMTSIKNDILLYVHMFNNQNVSNEFKNALFNFFIKAFKDTSSDKFTLYKALFNFFIKAFKDTSSDKFTLYKNILECYLFLSKGYQTDFPYYKLLANLSKDDSKQLHMFLSLANPSALENAKLAEFLNNDHDDHNDIIKNYLTKDTNNLKSIKNFNIYSSLLPKDLFVINYDNIINMMKKNTLMHNKINNDTLIKLILCYSRIEDSLKLSEALKLGDKLQVKYLIDPKFEREGVTSTGIEAFVDAITSQKGYLSNKGNYQYDTCSNIYNLLDIELSQHNKLIEEI